MKKLHLIGLLIIAIAIAVIMVSLKNTTTYADFEEAMKNPDVEYHVVGVLDKSQELVYEPKVNADLCSFHMTDNKGELRQVVLHKSPPQDIEKSEQIVLIGKMEGDAFHANDILMKCPSKYNDAAPKVE
ncbi:MAG: cytochrome c maturation protein CcmE [Sphingobacteriaceae bacterium]|nr:cytochrome c maturation protein CcmE [Sphingobacteriaceae bacterium]